MPSKMTGGAIGVAVETFYNVFLLFGRDFKQGNIMRKRVLATIATISAYLFLIAPSFANSLTFDFTILNGDASASGGYGSFTLNGNGTIAASLTSLDGPIVGFGFDSVGNLPESNFSTAPTNTDGWSETYGIQNSGFFCDQISCGLFTSMTWTIGNPGEFTSVSQALGGGTSTYDFFMMNGGDKWAANAVFSQTPLPAALVLFAGGLGVLGFFCFGETGKLLPSLPD